MGLSSGLFRGAALLTVTGLLSQCLGFFYRVSLSRAIGAETMGIFQLIPPLYGILLSATAVGLTCTVSTLSARRLALGDRGGVKALVHRCLGLFLLLGGGVAVLLALFSDFVSTAVLGDARTQLGLIFLGPCLLLTGVENIQKHFFYGTGRPRLPALLELGEQVVRTAAVLGLLWLSPPENAEGAVGRILLGMVLCEIFSALSLSLCFSREMAGVPPKETPGLDREVLSVAVPVGMSALLNDLLGSTNAILIPRLLVAGGMAVETAMAEYGVLFGMTIPLLCLPNALIGALGLVLMPDLAQQMALGRRRQAKAKAEHVLTVTLRLLLPLLAWLMAVGPEVGGMLYREPAVGRFLLPMGVVILMAGCQGVLGCVLNGTGEQKRAAAHRLIAGGVQLLFTVALVGRWGLAGYVVGEVASGLVGLCLHAGAVKKTLGVSLSISTTLLSPLLSATLMGLCVHRLFHLLLERGVSVAAGAGVCALFGAVLYLAAMQAQGNKK